MSMLAPPQIPNGATLDPATAHDKEVIHRIACLDKPCCQRHTQRPSAELVLHIYHSDA